MSNSTMEEVQTRKGNSKVQKPAVEAASEEPSLELSQPINPLEDLLSQAQSAYASYIGAQKKVALAYKQREEEEIRTFKEVEEQAQTACNEAIRRALNTRTESERNARKAYEEALEKSAKAYEEEVAEALKVCRETTDRQWQTSWKQIEQVWGIYQGNGIK